MKQGLLKAAMGTGQLAALHSAGVAAGNSEVEGGNRASCGGGCRSAVGATVAKVYRDGNSWVEETTGTLPAGREVRVNTDMGSVQVQGNSPNVTYVIRKRSFAPTEEAARRQFEQLQYFGGQNRRA